MAKVQPPAGKIRSRDASRTRAGWSMLFPVRAAECDGTFGRNEPLRTLKPAEITEKIQKISAFSGPQCVSGSMGESSQEFTIHRRLGAK